MKLDHGDARSWVAIAFVTVAGLAAYRLIPHYHLTAGALTSAIIVLMVLKHVGLLSTFGAPIFGFIRARLQGRARRQAADR